ETCIARIQPGGNFECMGGTRTVAQSHVQVSESPGCLELVGLKPESALQCQPGGIELPETGQRQSCDCHCFTGARPLVPDIGDRLESEVGMILAEISPTPTHRCPVVATAEPMARMPPPGQSKDREPQQADRD